ncbi:hypothetical protein LGR54_07230 [Ancylobacter sp. Lp-2]|nr:hypothetical protein [Ancylobacter sp. Lp-2]MCB4768392.1 hypothetical protein [Ancylobacter sp. Lp-2]
MKTDLRMRRSCRRPDGRWRHGHEFITHMAVVLSLVFVIAMALSRLVHP